jgi:hypothetical protein
MVRAVAEKLSTSSRNSSRHGLFAENIVLEAEDTGQFLELVESLFREHNPRTQPRNSWSKTSPPPADVNGALRAAEFYFGRQ